jgi:hypothetical protein
MSQRDTKRGIGPIGTASRVAVGVALLLLAGWSGGLSWGLDWYDPIVGIIGLPAVTLAGGLVARRCAHGPLRLTGPLAICVNCLVIAGLILFPYTNGGALLFYGATLLVAAWRGLPGCEATVISNLILGRDDQIGCPAFSPIDAAEARRGSKLAASAATGAPGPGR